MCIIIIHRRVCRRHTVEDDKISYVPKMSRLPKLLKAYALLTTAHDDAIWHRNFDDERLHSRYDSTGFIPSHYDYEQLQQLTPNVHTTPSEWENMKVNAKAIEEMYRLGSERFFGQQDKYKTFPIYVQSLKVLQDNPI